MVAVMRIILGVIPNGNVHYYVHCVYYCALNDPAKRIDKGTSYFNFFSGSKLKQLNNIVKTIGKWSDQFLTKSTLGIDSLILGFDGPLMITFASVPGRPLPEGLPFPVGSFNSGRFP